MMKSLIIPAGARGMGGHFVSVPMLDTCSTECLPRKCQGVVCAEVDHAYIWTEKMSCSLLTMDDLEEETNTTSRMLVLGWQHRRPGRLVVVEKKWLGSQTLSGGSADPGRGR
uniref:Uncharacterized protein n=1 Tax=Oryza meridionalis TaxID=40149 RepID=A0A0E0DL85_9ORYZ